MQDNGIHNDLKEQQNGSDNGNGSAAFPSNNNTRLRDISTLLQGAPVIQQEQADGKAKSGSAIATAEDFLSLVRLGLKLYSAQVYRC